MQILVYESTFQRLEKELGGLTAIRVQDDGTLKRDGDPVDVAEIDIEAAYAAPGMFGGGGAKGFFRAVLKSPAIRWFHSGAAGLDDPVFARIAAKGVAISVNSAAAVGMSEFVLAEVLALFQRHDERHRLQSEKQWSKVRYREVAGSTWLIIGFGAIGQAVAHRARAFGATILATRTDPSKGGPADEIGPDSAMMSFLPRADVVVIAAPLTDRTRDMVDAGFLSRMKTGSVLVNVGRGSIVDEDALVAALDAGTPSHAILDVFRTEPLPAESPLWAHPRITATAHTSALGSGFLPRSDALFLDNLRRFRAGEPLRNQVAL